MNNFNPYNCILLVDDDDTSLFLTQMAIVRNEFAKHTHAITNANEALDFIDSYCNEEIDLSTMEVCPDLIFLDINMPGMDGFDFLDSFNKFSEDIISKIKIFMLTSSDNPKDREMAQNKGVAGYIIKPLTSDKLKELIQAA